LGSVNPPPVTSSNPSGRSRPFCTIVSAMNLARSAVCTQSYEIVPHLSIGSTNGHCESVSFCLFAIRRTHFAYGEQRRWAN